MFPFDFLKRKGDRKVFFAPPPFAGESEAVMAILRAKMGYQINFQRTGVYEFFFYANTLEVAERLATELRNRGNTLWPIEERPAGAPILVGGNTPTMRLRTRALALWAEEMFYLADDFECRFDGWGSISFLD